MRASLRITPRYRTRMRRRHLSLCVGGLILLLANASLISATMAEPLTLKVLRAEVDYDEQGKASIQIALTDPKEFARLTSGNVGRKLQIRIGGKPVFTGVLTGPLLGGRFQLTGIWTDSEARDLAERLSTGTSDLTAEIVGR